MGSTPDHVMVLSLPNSGTDWLCPILAKHSGGRLRYFDKEYFNPITNWKHTDVLALAFGCELVTCYKNIAASWSGPQLDAIYRATWERSGCNFDKEVFSPFRVDWFAERFDVVIMQRPTDEVFPPSRARVWSWYDAVYHSLAEAGHVLSSARPALEERARLAHKVCQSHMLHEATRLQLPVLSYRTLGIGTKQEVIEHLDHGWIGRLVDVPAAAAEIVATRRYVTKQLQPGQAYEMPPGWKPDPPATGDYTYEQARKDAARFEAAKQDGRKP